jgi:ribosomal protein S18 acetylase RimI-like enzyme
VFVGPYVVGEPGFALVVADAAGIAGYCLATADTRVFEAWCEACWWPPLRAQYPLPADASPDGELVARIHAPSRAPDVVVAEYPAHLHIDLLERTRGLGLGRVLVERQIAALRSRGTRGLHLDVAADNAHAIGFYEHLGFAPLLELETSVLMGIRLAQG